MKRAETKLLDNARATDRKFRKALADLPDRSIVAIYSLLRETVLKPNDPLSASRFYNTVESWPNFYLYIVSALTLPVCEDVIRRDMVDPAVDHNQN